jgi:aminoglycoside phosphotransferase family enzyme/predicted kinase
MLIILTGLPGTGKSTVAAALARELDAHVLSTDRIRAEARRPPRFSPAEKGGVYERMFARAERGLRTGRTVILDGTFYRESLREAAAAAGRRAGVPVFVLEVVSPVPIVKRRMAERLRSARGPRPAGFEVHGFIRKTYEPVRGKHFLLDTADPAVWERDLASLANAMRVVEGERRIITALRRSCRMRLIQTHISWVLLDGTHAWKIKKPVRFSFVDYRSLDRRRSFCRKEVLINARLSPGLYLGVVPVRESAGRLSFGGPGRTVDYAVKMREMPQASRLDRLVARGRVGPVEIGGIVRTLCDFHRRAARAPREYGAPRAVAEGFAHAFRLRPLIEKEFGAGPILDRVQEKVAGFLLSQAARFAERCRQGRVRRCHGDLRMSNIFIEGGAVYIFDAVEFSPALAATDVAADVAYLAMDLRYGGKGGLAKRFIDAYVECSGDTGLREVVDFYRCYRALVRLLVEALFIDDPTVGAFQKRRARQAFCRYLALADAFARRL